jgi:ketosteroid isomerase-like protein
MVHPPFYYRLIELELGLAGESLVIMNFEVNRMSIHEEMQGLMNAMALAYRAGDAQACAQLFVPDGVLYSPYAFPAHGRIEIESLHRLWTDGGTGKKLTVVDAGCSGNLGWCLTEYSEGAATGNGTSLNVVERQSNGQWLIRICSLNSDEPPLLE